MSDDFLASVVAERFETPGVLREPPTEWQRLKDLAAQIDSPQRQGSFRKRPCPSCGVVRTTNSKYPDALCRKCRSIEQTQGSPDVLERGRWVKAKGGIRVWEKTA